MSELAIGILLLVVVLYVVNTYCGNVVWQYVDKLMYYIEDYYYNAFTETCHGFPTSEVTMYRPCPPVPDCETASVVPPVIPPTGSNVINITCGSAGCTQNSSCGKVTTPCNNDSEIIYDCYKYVLDKLPGSIFKYKIDSCGTQIESSKEVISHTLGILTRIYINTGNIIVEDSFSNEHVAVRNINTGSLSF